MNRRLYSVILYLTLIQIIGFNVFLIYKVAEQHLGMLGMSFIGFFIFIIFVVIYGIAKKRIWATNMCRVYVGFAAVLDIAFSYIPYVFVRLSSDEKFKVVVVSTVLLIFWLYSFWLLSKTELHENTGKTS